MKHQMTSGQRLDGNTPQRLLLSDDIDRLTRLLLRCRASSSAFSVYLPAKIPER
jgi:hypothetical protein